MNWQIVHIDETDSTNSWLRQHGGATDMAVWTDYQTAGRGQGSNHWESERGLNLLCSVLLHPEAIEARRQFVISMAVSLAVSEALDQHIGDIRIKWPNDIYWRDGKIAGILIENRLHGNIIKDSIVGIGLNVNQRTFRSDAPNPVSMWQISEHDTDRRQLLGDILTGIDRWMGRDVKPAYMARLYRRKGFYPYADSQGAFMAEIADVEDDGHLLLHDDNGLTRRYAFKEVMFV